MSYSDQGLRLARCRLAGIVDAFRLCNRPAEMREMAGGTSGLARCRYRGIEEEFAAEVDQRLGCDLTCRRTPILRFEGRGIGRCGVLLRMADPMMTARDPQSDRQC